MLGHKAYYPRLGSSAALARPLKAPFGGDGFMALELAAGALDGRDGVVAYPAAFGPARIPPEARRDCPHIDAEGSKTLNSTAISQT